MGTAAKDGRSAVPAGLIGYAGLGLFDERVEPVGRLRAVVPVIIGTGVSGRRRLEGRHDCDPSATSDRCGTGRGSCCCWRRGRLRCLAPTRSPAASRRSRRRRHRAEAATAGQRVIALTFDDGPGPFTPQVLSVLEQYRVPATFFEIGDEVARYSQYSKMVVAAGFPVEDHTWSHPDLTTLSASGVASQIDTTQAEIQAVTGTTPQCVRPPYDAWNATVLSQIAARGLTTMSYSVDPKDWTLPGVQAIVSNVVGAAFPGCRRRHARRWRRPVRDRRRPAPDHHPAPCHGVHVRFYLRRRATLWPPSERDVRVRQRSGSRPARDIQPATGWCGGDG